MELKTFIKETLTQIVEGVKEAQDETKETEGLINPRSDNPIGEEGKFGNSHRNYPSGKRPIEGVEFDVKLIVTESADKKEGIGVSVVGIKLGSEGEKSTEASSSSSVKFVVPIVLPVHEV